MFARIGKVLKEAFNPTDPIARRAIETALQQGATSSWDCEEYDTTTDDKTLNQPKPQEAAPQ